MAETPTQKSEHTIPWLDVRQATDDSRFQVATQFLVSRGLTATAYNDGTEHLFEPVQFDPSPGADTQPDTTKLISVNEENRVLRVSYLQPLDHLVETNVAQLQDGDVGVTFAKSKKAPTINGSKKKESFKSAASHLTYVGAAMDLSGRRGFKKHNVWQNIVTPTCWETKNKSDCVTTVFRAQIIDADTVATSDTYIVPQESLKPAQGALSSVSNTNALGSRKQDNSSDDSKPKKRPRSSRLDPSRAFAYGPKPRKHDSTQASSSRSVIEQSPQPGRSAIDAQPRTGSSTNVYTQSDEEDAECEDDDVIYTRSDEEDAEYEFDDTQY